MQDPKPPRYSVPDLAQLAADRAQHKHAIADLAHTAATITPADLRTAAVGMLTTAGVDQDTAGTITDQLLRILRGTIAPVITQHMLPCPRHNVPAVDRCPQCAWNTALLRASRIAHGHEVEPLQAWPPQRKGRRQ